MKKQSKTNKKVNSLKSQKKDNYGFFSKKNVDDSIEYIKESRNYIYFGIFLFLFFAIFGFFYADNLRFLDKYVEEVMLKAAEKEGFSLMMFIFLNNLSVATYNVLFGLVIGIFPFINSVVNGSVVGYVFARVYEVAGPLEFWRILPHGIFELPAIFIAIGLGIKNGFFFIGGKGEFKRRIFNSLKVLIFIILPLLFLAAIIESLLITFVK